MFDLEESDGFFSQLGICASSRIKSCAHAIDNLSAVDLLDVFEADFEGEG